MSDNTHKAPDRIWICNETNNIWIPTEQDDTTKYIRADLVQAAVAAALTEAAGVARLVRDTGDKAHALGIEENAAAYASAGEVIETRILDLITLDAQAALDRVAAAKLREAADAVYKWGDIYGNNAARCVLALIPKGEE